MNNTLNKQLCNIWVCLLTFYQNFYSFTELHIQIGIPVAWDAVHVYTCCR